MKILFVNDNYFSIGGANIANRNLVKFLLSKKIEVSIITCSDTILSNKSIRIYSLPPLIHKYPSHIAAPYFKKIEQIISKENPDIIHLQVPTLISLIALWFARHKQIPVIVGIHDLPENIAIYSPIAKCLVKIFTKKILAYGLQKINIAIAPSEFAKRYYKKLTPKCDIRVISNGINIENFKYSYLAAKLFRKNTYLIWILMFVLLYVGRVMPDKNLKTLIKAIEGVNAIVVLVGYIWQSYLDVINNISRGKIIATGYISMSLLRGAYSVADSVCSAINI